MIAALLTDRCTACQRCVAICPAQVFDTAGTDAPPRIARPLDCQTCFACELHCEADALYVDPDVFVPRAVDPAWLQRSGLLGVYRRDAGWRTDGSDDAEHPNLHWRMDEVFARGRALVATRER